MKNKISTLALILFISSVPALSQNTNSVKLAGTTWRVIEENGRKIQEGFGKYMLYTDTHFFWYVYNSEGLVVTGGGGTYTATKDGCIETVTHALPNMAMIVGFVVDIKFTLMDNGHVLKEGKPRGMSGSNVEIYEKVD